MKRIIAVAVILLTLSVQSVANLAKAEAFYEQQDYSNALTQYLLVLDQYPEHIDVLYNIGNCYFKLEQFGYAIAYYRKAIKWAPLDSDIQYNLELSRNFVVDEIKQDSLLNDFWQWRHKLSVNQLFYALACLIMLLITLLFLRRKVERREFLTNLSWVLSVCTVLISIWFALSMLSYSTDYGVVINKKIEVRSGPSTTLPLLFYIHEGHELRVKQRKINWCEIELSNGFKGWVKRSDLMMI